MYTIAIDAMGGDEAPKVVVEGAEQAVKLYPDLKIQLYGDKTQIEALLSSREHDRIEVIHASEKIAGDEDPVKAVRMKKDSSMVKAALAVKNGEADALLSAGNTGALLASGMLIVGRIKGVERPGLMPIIPTISKESPYLILMDGGANAECKPNHLYQFAHLASFYAKSVMNISTPRIGLLNNGTEANKGNELSKMAYQVLSEDDRLHFIGNVEAKELLNGVCDIVVTDGFTGNAVLKTFEGTAKSLFKVMKETLSQGSLTTKIGAAMIKKTLKQMYEEYDDTKQGGAILLGVKAPVIKAHGSSNQEAICNAIKQAYYVLEGEVIQQTTDFFKGF